MKTTLALGQPMNGNGTKDLEVWNMVKRLPGGFEADLGIGGGIAVGYMEGTPSEQKLGAVGLLGPNGKDATFANLSATTFSELVRDLEILRD